MKRALIGVAVVAVLAAIITASVLQKNRDGKGVKVYAEAVERRNISQLVKASGQVDPRVKVNVSAHVIAKIEELFVEEGQEVEKGQPFLRLEREIFVAAHNRALALLEIARTQQRQAEIDLEDAGLKLARMEHLGREGIATDEQLEGAMLAEKSAGLNVDQAREAVRRSEADLHKAADDLEKTTIYSPLTGRVIALQAEEGEVVVSGTMNNPASVIATVADLSEILVEVDVDETDIVHVRLGQSAAVVVDAVPDFEYDGSVVEIGSSGFSRPRQPDVTFFKVKVLLVEPDERLRPGMSARAEIEVTTHEQTLVVPIQAVVYRPAEEGAEEEEIKVAFVAVEGKAIQKPVEVGISDTTHAEILAGLEEEELVITGPHRQLKELAPDDAVKVEQEEDDEEEEGEES